MATVSLIEATGKGKGKPLPRELQISVMEHLVAQQCPIIALDNREHLEQIIAQLIDLSDVADKASDDVAIMAEEAIWSTAAIRPSFRLWRSRGERTSIAAHLPPGLLGFAHRIRHLELAIGMHLSAPAAPEPGYRRDGIENLWLATNAMFVMKLQFPALDTLIVYLSVDATGFCDEDAKGGTWWALLKSVDKHPFIGRKVVRIGAPRPPKEPHKTIRTWVTELLESANVEKVGKKRLFKLLVERDMEGYSEKSHSSPRPEGLTPWLLRCDEINFTNEKDMDSVVQRAWDSRNKEDHPIPQTRNMLKDCAAPTLLINTPYGAYEGC